MSLSQSDKFLSIDKATNSANVYVALVVQDGFVELDELRLSYANPIISAMTTNILKSELSKRFNKLDS